MSKSIYDQRLWNMPKKLYRIESNDVAERVLRRQQLAIYFDWLMIKRADFDHLAEAFDKVMAAYRA